MKDSFQGTTCILVRNYIICFRTHYCIHYRIHYCINYLKLNLQYNFILTEYLLHNQMTFKDYLFISKKKRKNK